MSPTYRDAFVILEVESVSDSLAFYVDRLGFEVEFRLDDDAGDPAFVQLVLGGGGTLGLAAAGGPVRSSSTAVWLYVDDVDEAFAQLRDAGAPVIAEPADRSWGERVASLIDPDGYTIHLGATGTGSSTG